MKNYLTSKSQRDHSTLVKNLSLDMFDQLKEFLDIKKYNDPDNLKLLGYGAMLHDIGVNLEKAMGKTHNKISRDLIIRNGIDNLNEREVLIVANIARYHRKKLPNDKHKHYKILNEEEKNKVNVFSSIVKLADALDSEHFSMVDGLDLSYNAASRTLTLNLRVNIMLNVELKDVLDKKKKLFEKTFNVKIVIK